MSELSKRRCVPCEGGVPALTPEQAAAMLAQLEDGWSLSGDGRQIERRFRFSSFHEVMAFANAVAWIAHREDHHPDLLVEYAACTVRYSTHAIDGLSDNDFICAAKVDALLATAD